ncbi:MAG TPA: DNA translocase FtsK 4TM domain-containing protein, partial [Bacteroidia bacterium]|nr:DNA translocase FtsK 4TM domain-containing protein [Bacteroidia bacterium]
MAEEVKKNKLKIPLSPEEKRTEIVDVAEEPVAKPKAKKAAAEKKEKPQAADGTSVLERLKKIIEFFKAEQTQRIIGLLYIFAAVYIGVACASYMFTWQADQDKVMGPSSYLFSPEVRVQNWFGKMGALLSHLFMYKWFGVSSFLFVPLLLLGGIAKAFQRNISISANLWAKAVFVVIWASLTLGFIFSDKLLFLGGGFGYIISQSLQSLIGGIGLLALLVLSLTGFIFIVFKFKKKEPVVEEAIATPVQPAAETPQPEIKNNTNKFVFEKVAEEKIVGEKAEEQPVVEEEEEEIDANEIVLEVSEKEEVGAEKKNEIVDLEIETVKPVTEAVVDSDVLAQKIVEQFGEYDPTLDLGSYQMPHLGLLNDYGSIEKTATINQEELNTNKDKIIATLRNYGIEIDKIKATIGPTVTLYEIVPAAG